MSFLYKYGFTDEEINALKETLSKDMYSEMAFLKNIVSSNIEYLRDFGVTNYSQVFVKYPEIFMRDTESFQNVLGKFDKEDLIDKVLKNPTVIKKMVDYVDNN